MPTATASEEVPLSADDVWKVIGNFDNIRPWAAAVQDERTEDAPGGPIRTLTLPNGAQIVEQLVAQEQYSYSYSVLEGGTNLDSVGTVSVVPVSDTSSRIELASRFTPPAGVDEGEAVEKATKFLRGNLKAMKGALGLS